MLGYIRMIASWGEYECEYAFVIKTDSTSEGKPELINCMLKWYKGVEYFCALHFYSGSIYGFYK